MILAALPPIMAASRFVSIDPERLAEISLSLTRDTLRLPTWDAPVFNRRRAAGDLAEFILLFNAINFCYWGDPKWVWVKNGDGGSFGVLAALSQTLDDGQPLLDAAFLAQITAAQLRVILTGRHGVSLSLLDERAAILAAVGATLQREFGGRFAHVLVAAGGDAPGLVELLTTRFPSFDDHVWYNGQRVEFHKRAQLAAAMIYAACRGQGPGQLRRVDQLTVFADYKLPQTLRALGILRYAPVLAAVVDNQRLIPAHSEEEIEIRAHTIWAAELLRQALRPRFPDINALHLDYWLWSASKQLPPTAPPHHRTLSVFY
jgi:hypothetical protein